MTELNPDPEPTETRVAWPAPPGGESAADADVVALLGRLGTLPGLPVPAHADVYAALHDELMEALNEDVTGHGTAAGDAAS